MSAFVTVPLAALSTSKVAKAAVDIYEEPGLQKLVSEGLHKQLQRTKDGATDKSRIQELAELVKQLRKCLKEVGNRTTTYIDQCVKLEKEWVQQAEGVKLSSQTSLKQLEAELASTRQSLAECEREIRNNKAQFGLDLETQVAEASRLQRELGRLTDERDKARDEAKRAELQRQQLEAELKDSRKTASQQFREVNGVQLEALRVANEERVTLENKMMHLREEHSKLERNYKALQDCAGEYEKENQLLHATVANLSSSLTGKENTLAMQAEQTTKALTDLAACREQLTAQTAEVQRLQQELATGAEEHAGLLQRLEAGAQELQATQRQLEEQIRAGEEQQAAWEEERKGLQGSVAALEAEHNTMTCNNRGLKAALEAALARTEALSTSVEREAADRAALQRERVNLLNQVEFASGAQAQAEQATEEVRVQLAAAEEQLVAARGELDAKDARLQHLEGEFEALKEVLGETSAASKGGVGSKDVVATLLSKIATLQSAAVAAEAVRRKLHNELVDLRGNIRVYCRVRPHPSPSTRVSADSTSIGLSQEGKEHCFSYDRVFGPDSSQESVFGAVSELVQSALDGFHVCIFSYGQTGAGKTHTMQGGDSPTSRGIIPRAVEKILSAAAKLEEQAEWSYTMEASFIEIYNNQLRDLLGGSGSGYISDQHAIKHDPDGGHTVVNGVSKVPVTDAEGAYALVGRAAAARAVEATAMNSVSSRSHSVFMLYITGWHAGSGTRLQGCLCLVDLAGSERLDRSLAEGQAKKEACAINQSLSSLGDVFAALSAKSSHVPYRNSKLTYLLQPCLGGSGKTLMFVNINPEPASAGESLCSLRFAAKVSGCETGAKGGARRNVMTLTAGGGGGGESGPSAAQDGAGAGFLRLSMSGLPRAPGAGGMDAAAAKRMSMAGPSRAGQLGTGGAGASVLGVKRTAGSSVGLGGNAAKRTRP